MRALEEDALAVGNRIVEEFGCIGNEWHNRLGVGGAALEDIVGVYRLGAIKGAEEFVFTYPGENLQDVVLFCGTHSGRDVDKIAATGTKIKKARLVKAYLLPGCLINLECKVRSSLDSGDHTIFVGEIIKAYKSLSPSKKIYTVGKNTLGAL